MAEGFTYESNDTKNKLELYEWDNIWWEYASDKEGKERVLIIGDSISCGYRTFINKEYAGEKYADGLGTSKGIDNPHLITLIDYMIAQCPNNTKILFNNGFHGWHIGTDEYKECYDKVISHILKNYPDKKVFIVLCTPLRDKDDLSKLGERIDVVKERNEAALEIASKYNLKTIDLYNEILNNPEYYSKDGVHLTDEGYVVLAKRCVGVIENGV